MRFIHSRPGEFLFDGKEIMFFSLLSVTLGILRELQALCICVIF